MSDHSYTINQLSSRDLPATADSLSKLPPFLHTGVPISEVHKTGLGSSAALITSLVSALLLHFSAIPSDSFTSDIPSEGRKLAHNLAQYVHCLAQGKVGSGFDVSAAAFGSQLYTRFDPGVIQGLMNDAVVSDICAHMVPYPDGMDRAGSWILERHLITFKQRLESPS